MKKINFIALKMHKKWCTTVPNSKFSWGRTTRSTALRDWVDHGCMARRGLAMEERRQRIGVEGIRYGDWAVWFFGDEWRHGRRKWRGCGGAGRWRYKSIFTLLPLHLSTPSQKKFHLQWGGALSPFIDSNLGGMDAPFLNQLDRCEVPWACYFNGYWKEDVSIWQLGIFGDFVHRRLICCRSWSDGYFVEMGLGESVRYCHVPPHRFAACPRYERDFVGGVCHPFAREHRN